MKSAQIPIKRAVRLIGFFTLVLMIFPLTHLGIMLWGDLFSARFVAQRLLPDPMAGQEWDFSSPDTVQRHLRFLQNHIQGHAHVSRGFLGYDFEVEDEEFSGLPAEIVNDSLWHGVQLKAAADDFDGIKDLMQAFVQATVKSRNLDRPYDPDVLLAIDNRGDALNLLNRQTLARISNTIYLNFRKPYPSQSDLQRLVHGAELIRMLNFNSGHIPTTLHKIMMMEVMIEIYETYSISTLDRNFNAYLRPRARFAHLTPSRFSGRGNCWDRFLAAAEGFEREFTRQSLETAMGTIARAQQACAQSPSLWIG